VGYGSGALAEISEDGNKVGETKLDAHPESFQLEKDGPRIYVNLPKSRKIAVVDREKRTILASWPLGMMLANYPMALDQVDNRLFVISRYPARLLERIYAIGGEGAICVFEQQDPDHYKESARITTVKGARTGFFSPELDRLFLAVRRQGTQPAAIRAFVPVH
jgi:hypothetical protein